MCHKHTQLEEILLTWGAAGKSVLFKCVSENRESTSK